jgi:glycine cleavage system H protein
MVKVDDYELREDLYYWAPKLTWAKVESDGRVRVGVTDLAQRLAGKIRFIRVKPKGITVAQGKGVATLETGKWIGPVESPVSGVIDEVNTALRSKPTLVNEDPYGEGWIVVLKPTNLEEDLKNLVHGDAIFDWYKKEIETRVKKKK